MGKDDRAYEPDGREQMIRESTQLSASVFYHSSGWFITRECDGRTRAFENGKQAFAFVDEEPPRKQRAPLNRYVFFLQLASIASLSAGLMYFAFSGQFDLPDQKSARTRADLTLTSEPNAKGQPIEQISPPVANRAPTKAASAPSTKIKEDAEEEALQSIFSRSTGASQSSHRERWSDPTYHPNEEDYNAIAGSMSGGNSAERQEWKDALCAVYQNCR